MKVSECMTRKVRIVSPDETIQEAARLMASVDAGVLPVGEQDRLVGIVTDRDITVRGVCAGKGPDTPVRDVMTSEVRYCFEDEDVDHVARNMGDLQVRRLPVMNRSKRLVGIVTIGDMACNRADSELIGEALGEISRAGGQHSQTTSPHH